MELKKYLKEILKQNKKELAMDCQGISIVVFDSNNGVHVLAADIQEDFFFDTIIPQLQKGYAINKKNTKEFGKFKKPLGEWLKETEQLTS